MKHKVQINNDNKLYGLDREYFEKGETVEFQVLFATDTDYRITSDQADVKLDRVEDGYKGIYFFMMPDEDVRVTVSSRNSMLALDPGISNGSDGTHKKGLFGNKQHERKLCPECNTEIDDDLKYCPECGHKLK